MREGYCGNCRDWTGAVRELVDTGMHGRYYDQRGNPISWARYIYLDLEAQRTGTKHVGDDRVGGVRVSTVWLGEDWAFGLGEHPQIFETAVFREDGDLVEIFARYADEETARVGHQAAVAIAEAGLFSA